MSGAAIKHHNSISVVIPSYNEAPSLTVLCERLTTVLQGLDLDWEIIVVDDGSTDGTPKVLRDLHEKDSRVKAVVFSRNFGQSPALTAGIAMARGDAVVIMDADGQDPPELIPAMVKQWRDGFEIVGGHRIRRAGEPLIRRMNAFLFYRLMNAVVGWELPSDTGEFRLIDRTVADVFRDCPQRHRLVRTLTSWAGFRQTSVDYEHGQRIAGKTKYSLRTRLRLAVTSITSFSLAPLRVAVLLGLLAAIPGFATVVVLLGRMVLVGEGTWLAVAIAGLWTFTGIQCILIGVVGEYVGRTYMETQHRPIYVVRETYGLETVDEMGVRRRT